MLREAKLPAQEFESSKALVPCQSLEVRRAAMFYMPRPVNKLFRKPCFLEV